ncbi:hypothetical protein O3M35_013218 [Rhynocoris fuscipes]|uniref:HSF-type DNA-binding domain-containing protein n=1 Tax=Rhynocoris fuscipes TaxID=488301 RepID=A0AAW1CJ78_9HEMI
MFSTPQANPNIPAFIGKLWHMVSNPKSDHLISWNKDGSSFIIKNHGNFSCELLPMYYKHKNLASFIRQLNKYGFHKVISVDSSNNDKIDFEFAHPDFIKDCPQLLLQIKRKLSNSKETEFKNDSNLVSKLLQDVQQLQAKQDLFESKLAVMKNENDALWREHSILRQRHQKQQKIVNKLIQFLVTLVQQTRGLNIKRRMPLMLKDGRPVDNLMAIKDADHGNTPLICEVDPYEVFVENGNKSSTSNLKNNVPIQIAALSNAIVTKDVNNLNASVKENNVQINVPSATAHVDETTFLNGALNSTPSPPLSNIDFAVPLQEVSPAIVHINKPIEVNSTSTINNKINLANSNNNLNDINTNNKLSKEKNVSTVSENLNNSVKRPPKRKTNNKSNKSNYLLVVPDLPVNHTQKDHTQSLNVALEHPLVIKSTDLGSNIEWNCGDTTLVSQQVDSSTLTELNSTSDDGTVFVLNSSNNIDNVTNSILSPSQSTITTESINTNDNIIKFKEEPLSNSDNNLVVSQMSPVLNKYSTDKIPREDMDNHLEMVQTDLDVLKDILHSEGLSLDASTLMGLFNADDPFSLNLPESEKNSNDNVSENGNEIVSYSSNLIDMTDILDENTEDFPNVSMPSPTELNTPLVQLNSPPYIVTSPTPSKRLKK